MRIRIFYTEILLFLCLFIQNDIYAQLKSNELTLSQYNTIKFHDVKFSDLEASRGELKEIQKLLDIDRMCEGGIEIGEKWRTFYSSDGLMISFDGLSENQKPEIIRIESNSISIGGKRAEIGDNINLLGRNLAISNKLDGYEFYSFTLGNADCCPISIRVDSKSDKILEILYFVQT